jgi:3',5'-cyclic AMP phosphodiesterase CpdA
MARPLVVVQVSDTHLSRTHAYFTANWPVFLGEMDRLAPDFIVNSGDISFNGPDNPDDLAFARACHDRLGTGWAAIGGNHDVGEAPIASRLRQPVNDARLAAWRRTVGPSWWSIDVDRDGLGLRLVGLDTALMGSGHPDEAVQAGFLEAELAGRDGRTAVVFVHMPPFGDDPEDTRITTHCILPEPRRWLLDVCVRHGVTAIAAGHIHRHTATEHRGLSIVTAPGTSFANLPAVPSAGWTRARAGYLVWRWDGRTLSHHCVEPRLFMTVDASNWTDAAGTTTNLPPRPIASLADVTAAFPVT